jgi:nitric oxide reductase NorE protein
LVLGSFLTKDTHIPGEPGVWIIIFGDMIVFGLMFVTFAYYRHDALTLFRTSQASINQTCGLINTVLMLTSSWFVAMGLQAARIRRRSSASVLFACALSCAVCFVLVKIFEYQEKIAAGFVINTDDFFMFYYVLTGIHLLHVLAGIAVLAFLINSSKSGFDAVKFGYVESGTIFWHLVDLLWIALFALLYLLK